MKRSVFTAQSSRVPRWSRTITHATDCFTLDFGFIRPHVVATNYTTRACALPHGKTSNDCCASNMFPHLPLSRLGVRTRSVLRGGITILSAGEMVRIVFSIRLSTGIVGFAVPNVLSLTFSASSGLCSHSPSSSVPMPKHLPSSE